MIDTSTCHNENIVTQTRYFFPKNFATLGVFLSAAAFLGDDDDEEDEVEEDEVEVEEQEQKVTGEQLAASADAAAAVARGRTGGCVPP